MQALLKIASGPRTHHLRNLKQPLYDRQRKEIAPRGTDAVLIEGSGKGMVLSEAEFSKIKNPGMISRIWNHSPSRGKRFSEQVVIELDNSRLNIGFIPASEIPQVKDKAAQVVSGSFQEIKGRVSSSHIDGDKNANRQAVLNGSSYGISLPLPAFS